MKTKVKTANRNGSKNVSNLLRLPTSCITKRSQLYMYRYIIPLLCRYRGSGAIIRPVNVGLSAVSLCRFCDVHFFAQLYLTGVCIIILSTLLFCYIISLYQNQSACVSLTYIYFFFFTQERFWWLGLRSLVVFNHFFSRNRQGRWFFFSYILSPYDKNKQIHTYYILTLKNRTNLKRKIKQII